MGAGELCHDQTAPALIPNQAAEYRVRYSGHGRQHGRRRNSDRSDSELAGEILHLVIHDRPMKTGDRLLHLRCRIPLQERLERPISLGVYGFNPG